MRDAAPGGYSPATVGGLQIPRLRRPWLKGWIPVWSTAAFLRAVRATVVVGGLFAFTDQVIGNLQTATFAAFGGFATLVLASFAGTRRDKLMAHLCLALAGSALLAIGTAVHSPTALAALVTVPVTFTVFFAGITGPNAASGVTAALLAYILPAASPGTTAMIPDRLAGWWLASVAGTAAVLLLSPRPGDDGLRAAASRLAAALADELEAALQGAADGGLGTVMDAKQKLFAQFNDTPVRPTGLAASDQALADAIQTLEWCTVLVSDAIRERADLRAAPASDRTLLAEAVAMLRSVSSLLAGGHDGLAIERLLQAREENLARLRELAPQRPGFREAAQISFHANVIAVAVVALGAETLVATGQESPDWLGTMRRRWLLGSTAASRAAHRVSTVASTAITHASVRSVWFINSIRGAVALAAAVAIADLSSVQHGFWVVLGTLSVLRTNAAATGSTALRALSGTAIGFVIGGALLLAIGSGSGALWAVLPVAVFVAAYSPGTAPFAVGQAAFTVTVAVLFNLLVPVGWMVGVVRIEDVAIGCAVSVLVGTLFWPRGVAAVVGDDLADVFRWGATYLTQAVERAIGARSGDPDSAVASAAAAERLDDGLRAWIAEQGTKHLARHELWRLIGGSIRLRLTARAVADLPPDSATGAARRGLARRTRTLAAWYEQLAELVGRPNGRIRTVAAPALAPGGGLDDTADSPYAVWLGELLEHLAEHAGDLVEPATRVAEFRRQPWWC